MRSVGKSGACAIADTIGQFGLSEPGPSTAAGILGQLHHGLCGDRSRRCLAQLLRSAGAHP